MTKEFIKIDREELDAICLFCFSKGVLSMLKINAKDLGRERFPLEEYEEEIKGIVDIAWNRDREEKNL